MWIRALVAGLIAGSIAGGVAGGFVSSTDSLRSLFGASTGEIDALRSATDERLAGLEERLLEIGQAAAGGSDLEQRIAAIEERFARIERHDPAAAVPELAPHLDPIWSQLERATGRLDELERKTTELRIPDIDPLATRLDALDGEILQRTDDLSARVAMVETRARLGDGGDGRLAAAALLLGDLRDALDSGQSFEAPLERLADLVDSDSFLARLIDRMRPHAAGVETVDTLAVRLDSTAVDGRGDGERNDWMSRTLNNLESLVSVHRVGHAADDPLAAARSRMRYGDLEGAMDILEPLAGQGGAELDGWLADARARQVVGEAANTLEATVRDLLATPARP